MPKTDYNFPTGAILSDSDIEQAIKSGQLVVKSPTKLNIQPSSLEVHLAPTILVFSRRRVGTAAIDLKKPVDEFMEYEVMDLEKGAVIHPG